LDDIKAQLRTYRTFASTAMYAKPVGRMEKCPACGSDNSSYKDTCWKCHKPIPQKIARGLSIRAAEAIAAAYKYNRIETSIEDIDAQKVRISASFIDLHDGRIWRDSVVLSKMMRRRDGTLYQIPDDRFYGVIAQAKKSILVRECINRMVPPGLRSELEACVEEQLDSYLDEKTVQNIVARFSTKNVSPEMLEKLLGKRLTALTKEDRRTLLGAWNSLEDGETTVAELFGEEESEAKAPIPSGAKALARSLAGGAEASTEAAEVDREQDAATAASEAGHAQGDARNGRARKPNSDPAEADLIAAASVRLAEMCNTTVEAAMARLVTYCNTMFRCAPADLTPKQARDVMAAVTSRRITI